MRQRMRRTGGSSPLTRGKPNSRRFMVGVLRLIPAHAGKTDDRRRSTPAHRAHPRSRGENRDDERGECVCHGSSPLTRGKPRPRCVNSGYSGLIPAHAGKTSRGVSEDSGHGAHPRSRGENIAMHEAHLLSAGSSPLTRGKPTCTMHRARCIGLIPAHAGKTSSGGMPYAACSAHPRSRGENSHGSGTNTSVRGSSPLTRGKRRDRTPPRRSRRLIPAHAGKTSPSHTARGPGMAHPRSRGENAEPRW